MAPRADPLSDCRFLMLPSNVFVVVDVKGIASISNVLATRDHLMAITDARH